MPNLLAIKASLHGDDGQSSRLVDTFLDGVRAQHQDVTITLRNLGTQPVPHLDAATFAAFGTPADKRDAGQRQRVQLSDVLIAELKAADLLVIGMPMYNFGMPSHFKAWIDHVARAGETFRYTSAGSEGLTGISKAWVLAARGGVYQGTGNDSQTPWLNTILGFLGVADIEYLYAEGLARSQLRAAALEAGQAGARQLGERLA